MCRELCNHRKRQFNQADLLLLHEPSTLWHQLGDLKSKQALGPIHYQINNIVQSRQPGNCSTWENPRLCSVWPGVTVRQMILFACESSQNFENCRKFIFTLMLSSTSRTFIRDWSCRVVDGHRQRGYEGSYYECCHALPTGWTQWLPPIGEPV